jgi:hypothetical protein
VKLESFSLREQRVLAIVLTVFIILMMLWRAPAEPDVYDVDHLPYSLTVDRMAEGQNYQPAMRAELEAKAGSPRDVRAFRLPTAFWLWRLGQSYAAFGVMVGILLTIVAFQLARPLVVPAIALYFMVMGYTPIDGIGWKAQWLTVEFWTAPWMLLSAAFWLRGEERGSVATATLAVFMREQAVLLLVGGLIAGRRRWLWLTGLAAFSVFFSWHVWRSLPWLVPDGAEPPPMEGGWWMMSEMSGLGLPFPMVVGPILLTAAWWRSRREPFFWPLLSLPLLGLLMGRTYWGLMVLPVVALLLSQPLDARGDSPAPASVAPAPEPA